MTREDPYRVQAERQKKRIPRMDKSVEQSATTQEKAAEKEKFPPRSRVHRNKRKKKKLKTPIITLLVFIFILLPISLLLINKTISERWFSTIVPADSSSEQFEKVDIQQNEEDAETIETVKEEGDKTEDTVKKDESLNEKAEVNKDNNSKQQNEQAEIDRTHKDTKEENDITNKQADKSKTVQEEKSSANKNTKQVAKEKGTKNESLPSYQDPNSEIVKTNTEPKEDKTENNSTSGKAAEGKVTYHTVQKGENLYRISLKYNISVEKIKEANHLLSDEIQLGQTLKIPLP